MMNNQRLSTSYSPICTSVYPGLLLAILAIAQTSVRACVFVRACLLALLR